MCVYNVKLFEYLNAGVGKKMRKAKLNMEYLTFLLATRDFFYWRWKSLFGLESDLEPQKNTMLVNGWWKNWQKSTIRRNWTSTSSRGLARGCEKTNSPPIPPDMHISRREINEKIDGSPFFSREKCLVKVFRCFLSIAQATLFICI